MSHELVDNIYCIFAMSEMCKNMIRNTGIDKFPLKIPQFRSIRTEFAGGGDNRCTVIKLLKNLKILDRNIDDISYEEFRPYCLSLNI